MDVTTFDVVTLILIDQLDIAEQDITLDATLRGDLRADSLSLIDLAVALEREFSIPIPDDFFGRVRTVRDAVEYIEERSERQRALLAN
jgi:acyl carrier protein